MESKLKSKTKRQRDKEKIHCIAYADDFIVTAASQELLKEKVIPIINEFLKTRGLELSQEKTKITPIQKGFDFLGFNIRKYSKGKLLIKPSKANIKVFLKNIRKSIKAAFALSTDKLIYCLNQKIVGWSNYYCRSVASETFSYIDKQVYKALRYYVERKHPNKRISWIMRKYFIRCGLKNWCFHAATRDKQGKTKPLFLQLAAATKIRRHLKIKANATVFDPNFKDYFKLRDRISKADWSSALNWESAGLNSLQPY